MDTPLSLIDPSLIQWNQLLEEDVFQSSSTSTVVTRSAEPKLQEPIFQPSKDEQDQEHDEAVPVPGYLTNPDVSASKEEDKKPEVQQDTILVGNMVEAEAAIRENGEQFRIQYRKRKLPKNFGNTDWMSVVAKKKLYLDQNQLFIKASSDSCIYECERGPDHDQVRKLDRRLQNSKDESVLTSGRYAVGSKKVGCEAKVILEERIYFPKFKIDIHSNETKLESKVKATRNHLRKLKEESPKHLGGKRMIWLNFSGNHTCSASKKTTESDSGDHHGSLGQEDVDRIYELAWGGLDKAEQLRSMFKTSPAKALDNHLMLARNHILKFHEQQDKLRDLVSRLKKDRPDDLIFFRPFLQQLTMLSNSSQKTVIQVDTELFNKLLSGEVVDLPSSSLETKIEDSFLFVYQTKEQQQSQRVCFLSALCSARRSQLSFYILSTSKGQPLALIVTSYQDNNALQEGLEMISFGKSTRFVVSDVLVKIKNCEVVLSDFAREDEWNEWFAANSSRNPQVKNLRDGLDSLASSSSFHSYRTNLAKVEEQLSKSEDINMLNYWNDTWLSKPEDWVQVFCPIKILDRSRKRLFLSIDSNASHEVFTESQVNFKTRRLINVYQTITKIIDKFQTEAIKPESSQQYSSPSFKSLEQILVILEEADEKNDSIFIANEQLSNVVDDLMPLITER